MLNNLLNKLDKTLRKTIKNQSKEIKYLRKRLKGTQISQLEYFIMTINEIQDVQAIRVNENEKDRLRNNIIDRNRMECMSKITELSNTDQSIDNPNIHLNI